MPSLWFHVLRLEHRLHYQQRLRLGRKLLMCQQDQCCCRASCTHAVLVCKVYLALEDGFTLAGLLVSFHVACFCIVCKMIKYTITALCDMLHAWCGLQGPEPRVKHAVCACLLISKYLQCHHDASPRYHVALTHVMQLLKAEVSAAPAV